MKFYKKRKGDTIWWIRYEGEAGRIDFSFDKETIYSLWQDYPQNLTKEQKELFDRENPYWAEYFKDKPGDNNA